MWTKINKKVLHPGIIKIAKTFMKKHPTINTIITGMLPRDKIYSFQRFMDQDDKCVNSDMILDKNFYYKYFLHLAEIGNDKFSKSTCLFLKQFLTEFRHPPSSSSSLFLCPSALSLLSPSLSS